MHLIYSSSTSFCNWWIWKVGGCTCLKGAIHDTGKKEICRDRRKNVPAAAQLIRLATTVFLNQCRLSAYSRSSERYRITLDFLFSWTYIYTLSKPTTAARINAVHSAGAASQPKGLIADWEGRRVSALSYHNIVWQTWTTVTPINTHSLTPLLFSWNTDNEAYLCPWLLI